MQLKAFWRHLPQPDQTLCAVFGGLSDLTRLAIENYVEEHCTVTPDYSNYRSLLFSRDGKSYSDQDSGDFAEKFNVWNIRATIKYRRREALPPRILEDLLPHSFSVGIMKIYRSGDLVLNDEEEQAVWNHADNYLNRLGGKVRDFEIEVSDIRSRSHAHSILQHCLQKLPKLQILTVAMNKYKPRQNAGNPTFPPLPSLRRMKVQTDDSNLLQILAKTYFDQIRSLTIVEERAAGVFWSSFSPDTHSFLPNLDHFSIWIEDTTNFLVLQLLKSPLKELKLLNCPNHSILPPAHVFRYLQPFGQTLVMVDLHQRQTGHNNSVFEGELQAPDKIQLPHLKVARLNICDHGHLNLDFLLNLSSSPEYLKLSVDTCGYYGPVRNANETIQITKFLHKLQHSAVWQLLPNLKMVEVTSNNARTIINVPWKTQVYKRRGEKIERVTPYDS